MCKKLVAVLVSVVFMLSTLAQASANYEPRNDVQIRSVSNSTLFSSIFSDTPLRSDNNSLAISYNTEIDELEDGTYNVTLNFDIPGMIGSYNATASGIVQMILLKDGTQYIFGPLDGHISNLTGTSYNIIVGFQTAIGDDEISAGVSLTSDESNLYFAFGDYIMPDEIYESYTAAPEVALSEGQTSHNVTPYTGGDSYSHSGGDAAFDDSGRELISILDTYYNPYRDVLVALVKSNAEALLTDSFFSTSRVDRVSVDFDSASRDSNIYRFYYLPGEDGMGYGLGDFVADVFGDFASVTGIPIPSNLVLNAIRNTLGGGVSTNISSIGTSATCTVDVNSGDFDDAAMPVAAVLDCTVSGNYRYTVTSNVKYICTKIKDIYYVNADEVSVTATLSVG